MQVKDSASLACLMLRDSVSGRRGVSWEYLSWPRLSPPVTFAADSQGERSNSGSDSVLSVEASRRLLVGSLQKGLLNETNIRTCGFLRNSTSWLRAYRAPEFLMRPHIKLSVDGCWFIIGLSLTESLYPDNATIYRATRVVCAEVCIIYKAKHLLPRMLSVKMSLRVVNLRQCLLTHAAMGTIT